MEAKCIETNLQSSLTGRIRLLMEKLQTDIISSEVFSLWKDYLLNEEKGRTIEKLRLNRVVVTTNSESQ